MKLRIEHTDGQGNVVDVEEIEAPDPIHDPAAALVDELVARAGDLWDALVAMPADDPARPAVEILADAALVAALPTVGA